MSFRRSEAKWRNITALCCVVPLRQEISGLRVSIELNAFVSIPTGSPARNDSYGEPLPCHFDRSEAEWRNLTALCCVAVVPPPPSCLPVVSGIGLTNVTRRRTPSPLRGPLRPAGKRVTGFSVVYRLPANPVPLPPKRGREHCVQNDGPGRKAPQRLTSDCLNF